MANYTLKPFKAFVFEHDRDFVVSIQLTDWSAAAILETVDPQRMLAASAVTMDGNVAWIKNGNRRSMKWSMAAIVLSNYRTRRKEPTAQPVIVCAAVRSTASEAIHASPRHFDSIGASSIRNSTNPLDLEQEVEWEEGFLDQFGTFYSRQAAWVIAVNACQIIHRCGGDEADGGTLYSENLY